VHRLYDLSRSSEVKRWVDDGKRSMENACDLIRATCENLASAQGFSRDLLRSVARTAQSFASKAKAFTCNRRLT